MGHSRNCENACVTRTEQGSGSSWSEGGPRGPVRKGLVGVIQSEMTATAGVEQVRDNMFGLYGRFPKCRRIGI